MLGRGEAGQHCLGLGTTPDRGQALETQWHNEGASVS